MPRVSNYLNFPGNTEEAFLFYKSVFKTEFSGRIARYKDMPPNPEQPALSESDQNLVLHVELPTLGDHVLMGTDATGCMGSTVTPGNNLYINLEPDTRDEAERLFNALADGGKIEMPLQDMFWGAYFGSLTDRFGIHWMVNCANKA